MSTLTIEQIAVGYGDSIIIDGLDVTIPENKITTIIGPNGCGKSTLLKTISRLLKAQKGSVYLDGKAIHQLSTKDIAKRMAILPQTTETPSGLTVYELVSYGRFPYQKGFHSMKKEDVEAVQWALEVTGVTDFSDRPVEALSGGQRQRVWIALALAQETEILVLDEPTTYLDLAHQLDILLLLKSLNEKENRTIVMVLHDLNHASRFSDYLIAMKDGAIVTEGTPNEVMTAENMEAVFDIQAIMTECPLSNHPICLTYQSSKGV